MTTLNYATKMGLGWLMLWLGEGAAFGEEFEWPARDAKKIGALARKAKKDDETFNVNDGGWDVTAPTRELAAEINWYARLFEEDFFELIDVPKRVSHQPTVTVKAGMSPRIQSLFARSFYIESGTHLRVLKITNELMVGLPSAEEPAISRLGAGRTNAELTRLMVAYLLGDDGSKAAPWFEDGMVRFFSAWDVRDDPRKGGVAAWLEREKQPESLLADLGEERPSFRSAVFGGDGSSVQLSKSLFEFLITSRKGKKHRRSIIDEIAQSVASDKKVEEDFLSNGEVASLERAWLASIEERAKAQEEAKQAAEGE